MIGYNIIKIKMINDNRREILIALLGIGIIISIFYFLLLFLHGIIIRFALYKYADKRAEGRKNIVKALKGLMITLIIWILLVIVSSIIKEPFTPPIVNPSF
ncbi:hypothetical protein A3D03_05360 [Candidatus Gottesmanbacteria bacterium RIFCSPHIGHO2_02_FULL_40_13]|uniref:Uncharacterized protein n=1 Tax=Candidatus Gottesmanbacteria bacterium RIFCSPHIGHO2_02_FULL_40_13 TaxID=1798384 RepID=A0A1F6A7A4_9BACT|nr:MAG: hypothetical protein A3D03_05360 [Candidatus Gottesmanbacteria bacterium RIFCSPHIGHO2_02_FULL_40_13]